MEFFDEGTANGESKSEFVYRVLRDNILNGTYGPGAALYIRELSSQLGVSRTPVKEAISRLAFEDYVELLPNRCAIVSRISATEVIELLELRESLERSAAYYAALQEVDYQGTISLECIPEPDSMTAGVRGMAFLSKAVKCS